MQNFIVRRFWLFCVVFMVCVCANEDLIIQSLKPVKLFATETFMIMNAKRLSARNLCSFYFTQFNPIFRAFASKPNIGHGQRVKSHIQRQPIQLVNGFNLFNFIWTRQWVALTSHTELVEQSGARAFFDRHENGKAFCMSIISFI